VGELRIGDLEIDGRAALAPLAGYTDYPFRAIVASYGCPLGYNPLVSARGLARRGKQSLRMLERGPLDCDIVGGQLFGSDPNDMTAAARSVVDAGFDFVDLNLGCPARKVRKQTAGAMLTSEPERMTRVFRAIRNAINVPVTAKIRIGIDGDNLNGVETACILAEEGADLITVHGRTLKQMYEGSSDPERIAEIVDSVNIPVLASGDVESPEDAKRLLDITGAAGVMIGRAAIREPHLITQANDYIRTGDYEPSPPYGETRDKLLLLFDMTAVRWGEQRAAKIFRKQLIFYVKGFIGARQLRIEAASVKSRDDVITVLEKVTMIKHAEPAGAAAYAS
jgi:nifR3 family TIM-barrel protein